MGTWSKHPRAAIRSTARQSARCVDLILLGIEAALDFDGLLLLIVVAQALLKALDALGHIAHQAGDPAASEQQDDDHHDDQDLPEAKSHFPYILYLQRAGAATSIQLSGVNGDAPPFRNRPSK